MSLPAQTTRNQYIASGDQTVFIYSFYIPEEDSLLVYLKEGNDNPIRQILNTNYTVQDAGVQAGGTITFTTAPAEGRVVTIQRNVPAEYEFNFSAPQTITGQNLDNAFEHNVLVEQQNLTNYQDTSIKYSPTDYITQSESPGGVDSTIVPTLEQGEFWVGGEFGNITKASTTEPPECSTLRTDLANEGEDTDGSQLVGYYDADLKQPMTVHEALDEVFANAITGAFSLQSMSYTFTTHVLDITKLTYRSVTLPTFEKIVNEPFAVGTGNGSNIGSATPTESYAVYLLTGVSSGSIISDIGTCALSDTPVIPEPFQNKYLIGYFVYGYNSVQCQQELTFTGNSPMTGFSSPAEVDFPITALQSAVQSMLTIPDLSSGVEFDFYKCYLECSVSVDGIDMGVAGQPGFVNFLLSTGATPSVVQLQDTPYNFSNNDTSVDPAFGTQVFMNTLFPAYRGNYGLTLWGQCSTTDPAVVSIGVLVDFFYRITTLFIDITDDV